ncbi:ATP-dependent RNA helicase DHX30 isoform X3 [Bombyx mori]|uniref:ATP-dependent RNA helicase DHX30 isoform X3 n=1 Tax=Bombyx mori TaxID=7091 RepID=UPI002ED0C8AA
MIACLIMSASDTGVISNKSSFLFFYSFQKLAKTTIFSSNKNIFTQANKLKINFPLRKLSSNILSGDERNLQSAQEEKDLNIISKIFPQPRVTLNILQSRTPEKVFEVFYKQNIVTLKGKKKKTLQNDWNCTYAFVWPEKVKFESTAISKRMAAEKAASKALHWLYINNRIDENGAPIYDRDVLNDIRGNLNEPIQITISDKSMERIDKIWNDYESGIKEIYEATFKEARQRLLQTSLVTKDSTIDEDDYSDNVFEKENSTNDVFEQKNNVHPVYGRIITEPSENTLTKRERTLTRKFELYDAEKTPLPIDGYAKQISEAVEASRVTVVVGEAGCGKSTRVPIALLQNSLLSTAIVSEPRRVAAIGLAQRVASELGEEVGETVGYQVRLHSKPPRPPAGSVLYCTSGVLLRRLQANPGLVGCTHVLIDEAHERDVNTDVTLLLLKRALKINSELKVVIMSATLDVDVFTRYFGQCPVIAVPGRTYPVEVTYLDDIQKKFNLNLPKTMESISRAGGRPTVHCQEIAEVIKAIDRTQEEGAILVFLPGWAEIKYTMQILEEHYRGSDLHMLVPVHSRLSALEQARIFSAAAAGVRRVLLATNVAETSLTVPDVTHVLDTGAHRENTTDQSAGTLCLETAWVSQAAAKQRCGRAGRVRAGHCYKLYTRQKEQEFRPHSTPEILRVPLVQTVLDCKSYAPDDRIEDFLSQLPEPPGSDAIDFAVNDLVEIGALTSRQQLTRLGGLLCGLALSPRVAVCLLHSVAIGNVIAAATIATHVSDNLQLFHDVAQRKAEILEMKRKFSPTCDYSALYWIQREFEQKLSELGGGEAGRWCTQHGLSKERLKNVKDLTNLYLEQLLKTGVVEPTIEAEELNRFSGIDELTSAVLLSGSDALLTASRRLRTKGKLATETVLYTSSRERAHVSSESVNHNVIKRGDKCKLIAYFGGHRSAERRALVLHKTSLVPPQTALLFSPSDVRKEASDSETTILSIRKHNLRIHMPTCQADYLLKAREMLWNTFKYQIERNMNTLDYGDNTKVSRFRVRLVKSIGRILVEGSRECLEGKKEKVFVDDE